MLILLGSFQIAYLYLITLLFAIGVMVPPVYPHILGSQQSQQFCNFVHHTMFAACVSVDHIPLLEMLLIPWQVPVWTHDFVPSSMAFC